MRPRCLIDLDSDLEPAPELDSAQLQALVDRCCAGEDIAAARLGILLVDEAESARLHGEHFDDPNCTDVMSFPDGSDDPETGRRMLGDLAVCWPVAEREAAQRGRPVEEECLLYVVHGLLHLLGYDDVDPADREEMWQHQLAIMAEAGFGVDEN